MKIGILLIATGKYDKFVQNLINSADMYLLTEYNVTYYVFTDSKLQFNSTRTINIIYHEHENWPAPTLFRYKTFTNNSELLINEDYLYYCDVDMLFVDTVGKEILSDRVAVMHPGFINNRGTPETRSDSLAYIPNYINFQYCAGGFQGGYTKIYLDMAKYIAENIDIDMKNNIIAIWHDESHYNKYLINNPPTLILNPGYCYPESWNLPYPKKLLALDKNHNEIRCTS